MNYIEFCAGIGGTRAGLTEAGWECILALDNDSDAIDVHRLAYGDGLLEDVRNVNSNSIPKSDVWIAGFPCQPFSSSGNRSGFQHISGNVFENILRLAKDCNPKIIILENVEGLLSNKKGHTFATILSELNKLDYQVDWIVMNLKWFDVPQSRPRLFLIANKNISLNLKKIDFQQELLPGIGEIHHSIFSQYLNSNNFQIIKRSSGSLDEIIELTRPEIGKPQFSGKLVFGSFGVSFKGKYISFNINRKKNFKRKVLLSEIVAPDFSKGNLIKSARYYSRGKGTQVYLRNEAISHCVGTSLGGAPLFAVNKNIIKNETDRKYFLQNSNWHQENGDYLVMRLNPARSVLLFGPYTSKLFKAINEWKAGDTRKFKLVGNMVAPICAKEIANIIKQNFELE